MTKNRFDKQAIRERMALTGEPYSVAAREISQLPLTTWSKLDEVIDGGFRRGSMYLIGSKVAGGSTQMAANLAVKLSQPNNAVAFICGDSTPTVLSARMANVMTKQPTEPEAKCYDAIENHLTKNVGSLYGFPTITEVRRFVESTPNFKAVIVEHAQLIDAESGDTNPLPMASVARHLKSLALELNLPVIVFANFSNSSVRQHFAGSGALETSSDVVLRFVRSDYFTPLPNGADASLTVTKNRSGEVGGEALLYAADGEFFA